MSITITWDDVQHQCRRIADTWRGTAECVYGVPRGGTVPAAMVATMLEVPILAGPLKPLAELHPLDLARDVLVVDDIIDSGVTASWFAARHFDTLYASERAPDTDAPRLGSWAVFPWEVWLDDAAGVDRDERHGPTDAVRRLLQFVGEDPDREGLLDTPARVIKALGEMTAGYGEDAEAVLGKTFDPVGYHDMVVLTGCAFTSMCEHHMLPFTGTATVGYLPNEATGRIVGVSKLARVVEIYARRLQVQERMCEQIADVIERVLEPGGVGVVLSASHACMGCRGVKQPEARMFTSTMRGAFRDQASTRAEFLSLAYGRHQT